MRSLRFGIGGKKRTCQQVSTNITFVIRMTEKHMKKRHASDVVRLTFINRIFAIAFHCQSEHEKIPSDTTIPKHKQSGSIEMTFFKLTELLNLLLHYMYGTIPYIRILWIAAHILFRQSFSSLGFGLVTQIHQVLVWQPTQWSDPLGTCLPL